jgi:hypothetical protein
VRPLPISALLLKDLSSKSREHSHQNKPGDQSL